MKSNLRILAILALAILLSGCGRMGKFDEIALKSYKIESIVPTGLRSVQASVSTVIVNPALSFSVSDINGVIYYKGEEYATFNAAPVTVPHGEEIPCQIEAEGRLAKGVSIASLLRLTGKGVEDFSADINAEAKLKNGISKRFVLKNIAIKSLINR